MGFTSLGNTPMRLKNLNDWLHALTCVLKENYKYAQKQNLEVLVKQIFLNVTTVI
jgi:hypothetical protein